MLTSHQRQGLGEKLLKHILTLAQTSKVYVGTWSAADWPIKFYAKNGFELVSSEEKNKLLKKYWCIPERQVETSVVLELKKATPMKQTLILKVDAENPDPAKIQIAAEIIQRGGLVAFPTETVYGLGADALNADAVVALFEAKKRPLDNPPILHVAKQAKSTS